MQPITEIVMTILAEYDLEDIVYEDYNLDEYKIEAESITAFIINNHVRLNETILADNIQYVFLRYFSDLFDYDICIDIAQTIIEALKLNKLL